MLKRCSHGPPGEGATAREGGRRRGDPVEALLARIATEYDALPPKLASVARYVERHRGSLMVDRVSEMAERCGVQPSAVVRFAQRFGYSGFSEMQAVFRAHWSERAASRRRTSSASAGWSRSSEARSRPARSRANSSPPASRACTSWTTGFDDAAFASAVALLERAQHIYVVGVRRSYPVAAYITYALQHVDKRVQLDRWHRRDGDGAGALDRPAGRHRRHQLHALRQGDACLRAPRAPPRRAGAGADRQPHVAARAPRGRAARRPEGSAFAFRSLTNTLCLGQALFVALAYRLESSIEETTDRGRLR